MLAAAGRSLRPAPLRHALPSPRGGGRRCWLSSPVAPAPDRKTVLVLGSSGALGSVVAKHLSGRLGAAVVGADVVEIPSVFTGDWELDGFVSLPRTSDLNELTLQLVRGVHFFLSTRTDEASQSQQFTEPQVPRGLDAIVVASGGWSSDPEEIGGDTEPTLEENAARFCASVDDMRRRNLDPCIASGFLAQHFMNPSGLLVVMGATAALQPTPGMVGYGLSKAAAHFLVQTLGACTKQSLDSKSVRKEGAKMRRGYPAMETMSVVGVLPTTIDTAANRRAFPHGDYNEWVRPMDIATQIATWIEEPSLRPHSGSLVKVHPAEQHQGAMFELVR